ncbi:MAG: PKD domain-containing protein [Bacteroidota bacterium]
MDSCAEIVCDSLDNYAAPSNSLYTINGVVGYVSGHNDFLDQAKAEYFANPRNKSYLTALEVAFGKAVSLNPANQFATLQIWDEDGTNGQPGSILGSTSVSIAQIQADIQAGQPTFVQFQTPVSLNAGFYAGVVLNYGQQDTLALLTNNDGQSSMNTAWELWSNNSWHAYDEGASWGLSLSHAITAYTTDRNVQADFSFEPEICAGTSLQLSNNSRDALLYDWTFAGGDSTHSSLENPMITYAQAGTYPIQLQATGECYLQSIAVDSIYVGSIPAIQFSQVQHSTCDLPNGSATVSIDGGTGILSYSWSTIPMQTSATATALSFGQYSISITDEIGCSSIDSVQISTTPPFTSGVNVVSTSCGQDNGTATAMMNGGTAPFSFVWNSQPNQYSQTATDLAPGTYVVQITDSAGCSDQISFNIEASQGPSLQVSAENTSCEEANGSISLGVIDANGPVQYSWSGLPNEQGSSVQGLSAGTYHFTITDSLSCVISDSVSLNNVGEIPQLALGEDQTICDSLYLDASVVDGSSWNWSSGQQTEGIWVSGSGTYAVLVENQAGCVANDTIEITREYLPEQSISILQDASLLLRYQFQVNPSNQASGVSYLWDFGDGNTSQQMNPIYTYIQPGTYVVSLSAINECGQSMEQDSVQILTTSISDIPTLAYALYPNPSKETSLLQWEKQADGILWIYDAQGKLIQQTEIVAQQQEQQLDASKLASGLYFLRLRLGQEEQFIRWVVQP